MDTEDILTFKGRVVVPRECRGHVLENLRTAHQGVMNMLTRAAESVWWTGPSVDVGALCLRLSLSAQRCS